MLVYQDGCINLDQKSINDAKYLIKNLPKKPNVIVADKGYDAEQ